MTNKVIFYYFLIISFLIYSIALVFSSIGIDAGSYIRMAQMITEGKEPFIDYKAYYMPLSFYITALFSFFDAINYEGYSILLYSLTILNSILIFCIVKYITNSKNFALLNAFFFIFWTFFLQNYLWNLEIFVLLFIYSAIYYLITSKNIIRYFFIGVLTACSFLCKQYALLFAPILFLYITAENISIKQIIRNILLYGLGYSIILIFFIIYFTQNITFLNLINLLSGKTESNYIYGNRSGGNAIGSFLEILLFIIPAISYFLNIKKLDVKNIFNKNKNIFINIIGLIFCSIQFYFNDYPHYYILAFPFFTLIFSELYKNMKEKNYIMKRWLLFLNFIGSFIALLLSISFIFTSYSVKKNLKNVANEIIKIAPDEKEILLDGFYDLYFMTKKTPAEFEKYGFYFYQGYSPEQMVEMKQKARLLLSKNPDYVEDKSKYEIHEIAGYYIYKKK